MPVSVLIPVFNALPTLPRAVESVLGQDLPPTALPLTLWVVDNGSTDGSWEWLEQRAATTLPNQPALHIMREDRPGPAAARNAGLRAILDFNHLPTSLIALMDADCEAPPNWLRHHLQALDHHPEWMASGGPLRTTQFDHPVQEFIERQGIMDVAGFYQNLPHKPPLVLTANMILRPQALELIGLFNQDLRVGEDADWCWRLQWAGAQLGFTPDAPVEHRHRTSVEALARMMRSYGEGSIRVARLHRDRLPPPRWDWVGTYRLLRALLKWILRPLRRLTPYQRTEPTLEIVRYANFLRGQWQGLRKN